MPMTDQELIAQERLHPRIVDLWFALQPLRSVVSFMNTGAHPDDETSAMLAALGFRDGVSLSFACANRGEGGQNDIGTESGAALGALRTREMERASDVLAMRLYWLSESPDDKIFDFGFSKSGEETFRKWGHDRTLQRFVEIIRTERPDIICPTFLDIPGQHGHHRAMTAAAHEVMTLASDPDFDCDLKPWQVKKMYLPAWSGAGSSYDDELPPPPTTLMIEAKGSDPVTGWSWEHIAQHSRAYHKTQGMGRWLAPETERDWPLHLAHSYVEGPDETIFSGLPRTLQDLGFEDAQAEIDAGLAVFPNRELIIKHLSNAYAILDGASKEDLEDADHRVARKLREIERALYLASDVRVSGQSNEDWLRFGESLQIESHGGPVDLPEGWNTTVTDGYRSSYDPARPVGPSVIATVESIKIRRSLASEPVVLPARSVSVEPKRVILNSDLNGRDFELTISNVHPSDATVSLDVPQDWKSERTGTGFVVTAPRDLNQDLTTIRVLLDGEPAHEIEKITYPHINPTAHVSIAEVQVKAIEAQLPDVKVGYLGAGNDRVHHWLSAMGVDVAELAIEDLNPERLAEFDTIVIGIFALRFKDGLAASMLKLHTWVHAGGNLVTLYHRPWDNWDANSTPLKFLEIGQPSLRWRVTDESAEVTHLAPDHALLNSPNTITKTDWSDWDKERGLYFAKSWDGAYTPILEMSDPNEAPHKGSMLTANIGKGKHTHTSLILHHQMENLVPGAFRIMANLIAKS